jgi:hypothetical protein
MRSDIDARVAATAAKQHAVFARKQAEEAGFTESLIRNRVRYGRWEQLARDVFRLPGAPVTWRQRVTAAVLEAGPGAVASHRTAAALLGIPGFEEGPVEVTQPECRSHTMRLGRLHQSSLLPPEHVTVIDGIACTSLARTIFDLAWQLPRQRLRIITNVCLSRMGLTVGRLEEVVASLGKRGRAGTRKMRELLDVVGEGYVPTESELEELVLAVLRAAGVELPEAQVWVGGERAVGRVDFRYRRQRVVIEAQSRRFHHDWAAQEADMARRAELAAAGYRIIEVTWWQLVHEPHVFVERVRRALVTVAA